MNMLFYMIAIVFGLLTLTGAEECKCANSTPKDTADQFCFPGAGCNGRIDWSTEECDEFCTKHSYQVGACLNSDRHQCCCYNNLLKRTPFPSPQPRLN